MEKFPNWLRYILAIPYGILLVIIIGIVIWFSNLMFADPNSLYTNVSIFLYRNGINILVMFWGINIMLPSHKFKITLTLSIIIGIFYSIIQGMSIMANTLSLEYIIAYIEVILALVLSCYTSFKNKFELD